MSLPTERKGELSNDAAGDRLGGLVQSVGHQNREIVGFVAHLVMRGVDSVADVRLNAFSRRPGSSKAALRHGLNDSGVGYLHLRAPGNPRENRPDLHGGDLQRGRDVYRRQLRRAEARAELDLLASLVTGSVFAVLCFEADDRRCHRAVVIEQIARS